MQNRVVLASGSPRRRELLSQIGLTYEVIVSQVEEVVTCTKPQDVVLELSDQKAVAVFEQLQKQQGTQQLQKQQASLQEEKQRENAEKRLVVIGSDTVVACDGKILGKPADASQACEMLQMLQGRSHEVFTGVTVYVSGQEKISFFERTQVHFYPMTKAQIDEYVATGDPLDKAGSYGIQGFCARYIQAISGDYNNVVGLPIGRLYQELNKNGLMEDM